MPDSQPGLEGLSLVTWQGVWHTAGRAPNRVPGYRRTERRTETAREVRPPCETADGIREGALDGGREPLDTPKRES
ncbi:hypothetical protein GCM10010405_16320 [Streptomyces macrosporus]|uniref:Uncharacterized protein n=1 Tax=Streptomyces macrosporus TaxID=44032 RepID=A0ABP5WTH7_9ACTN